MVGCLSPEDGLVNDARIPATHTEHHAVRKSAPP
jgi:hypothetical protein